MPERIIDRLEPVQVHEQHRDAPQHARGPFYRHFHAIGQQCAVGKPGERIVVGKIQDAPLGCLALGNIARNHNESGRQPGIGILARNRKLVPECSLR